MPRLLTSPLSLLLCSSLSCSPTFESPAEETHSIREQPPAPNLDPVAAPKRTLTLALGEQAPVFERRSLHRSMPECGLCLPRQTPAILIFGSIKDQAFRKDLQDIDAITQKWGYDALAPQALLLDEEDDNFALRYRRILDRLDLKMPIHFAPVPEQLKAYAPHPQKRTILLLDSQKKLRLRLIDPRDYAPLDAMIKTLVPPQEPPLPHE